MIAFLAVERENSAFERERLLGSAGGKAIDLPRKSINLFSGAPTASEAGISSKGISKPDVFCPSCSMNSTSRGAAADRNLPALMLPAPKCGA